MSDRPTRVRHVVLAWLCLAAAIAYVCRQSIAVAESTMRLELGLSDKQMGWVISTFFLTYFLFQLPGGWLGYRFGTRTLLPLASVAWSLATAAMGLAQGLSSLVAARACKGAAQTGLFPCTTETVARWFPPAQRALANGAVLAFMSAGAAVGAAATGYLLKSMGWSWRWIFALYGLAGQAWALGFWLWFRDLPERHAGVNAAELAIIHGGTPPAPGPDAGGAAAVREPTPWRAIVTSPATWWLSGQQFFRAAGQIFFGSWFPTYLQEARGVTVEASGLWTMLPLLALMAGSFAGGVLSDAILARTGSRDLARRGLSTVSMLACVAFVLVAYGVEDVSAAVVVISVGSFASALAGPCAYTISIDMGGRHVPTVFSVMNMAGNFGAFLFPTAVPWFRAATSWDAVLLLFGAMYAGAAVSWWLLDTRGTVFDQALRG